MGTSSVGHHTACIYLQKLRCIWVGVLVALSIIGGAHASSGDQSHLFWQCMNACQSPTCNPESFVCSNFCPGRANDNFWLHLWKWDCQSDCRYLCMWHREKQKEPGNPGLVEKYHGKWPFVRVLGMQEIASVFLSLLNLAVHLYVLLIFKRRMSGRYPIRWRLSPYTPLYIIQIALSVNAWLWSAIFHGRDTPTTEKFDYFSAGGLIAFNLILSLVRVTQQEPQLMWVVIGSPITLYYLKHCRRMLTVLFDYGGHVQLCIIAGVIQSIVWIVWALFTRAGQKHPSRGLLLTFIALVNTAMLLEVLDFPPILGLVDAHALWHAATIPLTVVWYMFVENDVFLNRRQYRVFRM